jgi:DNA-directed RNA polymerase specialized sigma24 family protein
MTMTDIGKDLGICRSAVHRRYQRARQRIKEYLEKIPKK